MVSKEGGGKCDPMGLVTCSGFDHRRQGIQSELRCNWPVSVIQR